MLVFNSYTEHQPKAQQRQTKRTRTEDKVSAVDNLVLSSDYRSPIMF